MPGVGDKRFPPPVEKKRARENLARPRPRGKVAVTMASGDSQHIAPVPADWALTIPEGLRTRLAPAPTGYLHLGHAVNALFVCGLARARGARILGRLEDHDSIRSRPAFDEAIREDLAWLGLVPDEPWTRQSENAARYEKALARLHSRGLVYACDCSRKTILARAPVGSGGTGAETPYDGFCRERGLEFRAGRSLRLRWPPAEPEVFQDILLGPQRQDPPAQCGDLTLKDARGDWTYQFAVTVDDLESRVDLIIRGADILESTGRQLRLGRLLGRTAPPLLLHHDLVIGADGRKLSKRDGSRGIRELRRRGRSPQQVLGLAARAAGLLPRARPLEVEEIKYLFLK